MKLLTPNYNLKNKQKQNKKHIELTGNLLRLSNHQHDYPKERKRFRFEGLNLPYELNYN